MSAVSHIGLDEVSRELLKYVKIKSVQPEENLKIQEKETKPWSPLD